jgi:hypothetical protein
VLVSCSLLIDEVFVDDGTLLHSLVQVFNDVVIIEDTLRDIDPSRVGKDRIKKVDKPLGSLETDLKRLTAALTEADAEQAAGLLKPLAKLCPDGYLICD